MTKAHSKTVFSTRPLASRPYPVVRSSALVEHSRHGNRVNVESAVAPSITSPTSAYPVLVAIKDPVLKPDVLNAVAATGRKYIELAHPEQEFSRHIRRASVVLIDTHYAQKLVQQAALHTSARIFLLATESEEIDWQLAMKIHSDDVFVLPAQELELLETLGQNPNSHSAHDSPVIAVLGASGGAGTSTFAACLAHSLSHSTSSEVALCDAHPLSGGLDLLLGIESQMGVRWPDLSFTQGTISGKDLVAALPQCSSGVRVLSHARGIASDISAQAVSGVLESLCGCASVVVDCPVATDITHTVIDFAQLCVLLVPAEVRAAASASVLIEQLNAQKIRIAVVLVHRGWSGMNTADMEYLLKAPICAQIPKLPALAKTTETTGLSGKFPRAMTKAATHVLDHLQPEG
ncbi:pilus assembly protein [Corynebacterium sp. sy017]|uniref:septum site-determining protein Ssd n=1 Tax=unclassified Corynebacterium TaxID=2624378 RepID=UPI0011871172|nr:MULTISPECIES: septum site-determining protein Ssd [unclassified Corynebacterium]MBP3089385.1 pilus assembly protein [Corynebacterium sp. sy017]TSD90924.1 pilus assembly protein [Corynebacterium sp. SY003]